MSIYILKIITLLDGLALFLFGMDVMGKSLERMADGKLDAHEYLNALKSGQLRESAQYNDLFRRFRANYLLESARQ